MKKWFKRLVCRHLGHRWQRFDFLIVGQMHITVHIACGRCMATTTIDKANDDEERIWSFTDYLVDGSHEWKL
jgi:hypothetical protein